MDMARSGRHARTLFRIEALLASIGLAAMHACTEAPPPAGGAASAPPSAVRDQPASASGDSSIPARNDVELEVVEPVALTDADFQRHVDALRDSIPDEFSIVVQRPFVVLGDESPAAVRSRAINTVKWAVDRLRAQYFQREPDHIINIWLFKDDESYERNAREMFGERPTTPFGYYSPRHRALVMNISTGGGTLVHEIVHPFISANFPKCPAWFNEGLASLYEQASERDGRIIGLTNWRLAGLQELIKADELPSFQSLTRTSADEFYADGGANYAQARYLCYDLQKRGLLKRFYDEFASNVDDDPTGYTTLQRVLGVDSMDEFQQRWEQFILDLRFPEE